VGSKARPNPNHARATCGRSVTVLSRVIAEALVALRAVPSPFTSRALTGLEREGYWHLPFARSHVRGDRRGPMRLGYR